MNLTKQPKEYSAQERQYLYRRLTLEALFSFTPNFGKKYGSGQISAAKGQATKAMLKAGF